MSEKLKIELIEWTKAFLFAGILGLLIFILARPSLIVGSSMLPTFENKDVVLVQKVSYFFDNPNRGDIIVAKTNLKLDNGKTKNIIKRVIGLPGDEIRTVGGNLFVNGKKVKESYIYEAYTQGNFSAVVPDGKIFVMGDNRQNSSDSRDSEIGFIPFSKISGKVYFRVWPIKKIGTLK